MSPPLRAILLSGGLAVATGCFSYVPTQLTAVPEGEDIRVHLTRQGLADTPEVPDDAGSAVRGRLMSIDADQVVVRVPVARRAGPLAPAASIGQDFTIPVRGIERVDRREFSGLRTALSALGAAAILVGIVIGFDDDGDGGSQPLPGPPSEESSRIPVPPS